MKKLLLILVALTTFSVGAFASDGIWLGVTGIYDSPMNVANPTFDADTFNPDLLIYGLDAKWKLMGFLNVEGLALYMGPRPYDVVSAPAILTILDAGIYFDFISIINVGVGIGPNFVFYTEDMANPVNVGVNIRADLGLEFGKFGVNLYGILFAENFEALGGALSDAGNSSFLAGLSVVFKL